MTTTTSQQTAVDKPLNSQPTPVEVVVAQDITTSKPTEETVLIDDPTNLEPEVTTRTMGSTASAITVGLSFISLCFLAIIVIVPLLQLIFGLRYADKCSISWYIPNYLVVAGVVGLTGIGLHMILNIYEIYTITKSIEISSTIRSVINGINISLVLIMIFLSGWFIAGCVWVFRVWGIVQYKNPKESDYCHPKLYRFAYWILFISIIYQLFTIFRFYIYGSELVRRNYAKKKKSGAISVPTTELK